MIALRHITAWQSQAPWPTPQQIEQDLLLSRLIVEIAENPALGEHLVFRGGTCLHKLHLPTALRYSEDLDYIWTGKVQMGPIYDELRAIGDSLGFDVRTKPGLYPKTVFRTTTTVGDRPLRIKVEVNLDEQSPAMPLIDVPYAVDSQWFTARTNVRTFQPAELVSTKIRALYQRKKGRDVFDLWLALNQLRIPPTAIISAFGPYRPSGMTTKLAQNNLAAKLQDQTFCTDLDQLVSNVPPGYNIQTAGAQIGTQLLALL